MDEPLSDEGLSDTLCLLIRPARGVRLCGVAPCATGAGWLLVPVLEALDVGRAAARDGVARVRVDHAWVSRHHLRLVWRGEALWACPLGDRVELRINGLRVRQPQVVRLGDAFGLGGYALQLVALEPELLARLDAEADALAWLDALA